MVLAFLILGPVLVLTLTALVQWYGKRDFAGGRGELSNEALKDLRYDVQPSDASVESGEIGISASANSFRNIR